MSKREQKTEKASPEAVALAAAIGFIMRDGSGQQLIESIKAQSSGVLNIPPDFFSTIPTVLDDAARVAAFAPLLHKLMKRKNPSDHVAIPYLLLRLLEKKRGRKPSVAENRKLWSKVWKTLASDASVKAMRVSVVGKDKSLTKWRESTEDFSERRYRETVKLFEAAEEEARRISESLKHNIFESVRTLSS